ncbi:MAG: hypothetical protein IJ055_02620 [Oscillospiraceae bacterium]|nr:hypothetical protein [Oscillospiraceae bacterium]
MKVRKIVAALAAVSMLAAVSAQAVSAAGETVTIKGAQVSAAAGEAFSLTVELSDVPSTGINALEFNLAYDTSVVTVTGVTAGPVASKGADDVEGYADAPSFYANYATAGSIDVTYSTGLEDSNYWITENGVFLTVTGTVNADAQAGDSTDFTIGAIGRNVNDESSDVNTDIIAAAITSTAVTTYGTTPVAGKVTVAGDSPELEVTLWGDADVDGDCDIIDVICVNKDQLGSYTLDAQGIKNADVDQNGVMAFADAVNIMKSLVDLVTLPVA